MNNLANKSSFWSFLEQTKIRIPIIQRDYAQGRKGKESLRQGFLFNILEALKGNKVLKLDFVYGSGDGEGHFLPLDGQQRLTTLWLLHWFLAYKTQTLSDPKIQGTLLRFSYETRESSKDFISKIVTEGCKINKNENENIADAILRQSWMYSAWRQDPTVQSMLRMLSGEENEKIDGIEELFEGTADETIKEYWDSLLSSSEKCPIIFYQIDIDNMGQSDDLYIKMNGRGKPLSDFENFKADLISYFQENEWNDLLDPEKGYPILLDTQWTDFFWSYCIEEKDGDYTSIFDDIFYNFINRFFLVNLLKERPKIDETKDKSSNIYKAFRFLYTFCNKRDESKDEEKRASYSDYGFGVYKTIFDEIGKEKTKSWFDSLRNVMCNISELKKSNDSIPVNSPYYSDKEFTPVYVKNNSKADYYSITQQQIIAFWGMCHYFEIGQGEPDSLKEWMRIIWNICDFNNEFRDVTSIANVISVLSNQSLEPHNPHKSILTMRVEGDTALDEHIKEEKIKIEKFDDGQYAGTIKEFAGKSWKEVIELVEKKPFFTGTIRCLLYTDIKGIFSWDNFDKRYDTFLKFLEYDNFGSIATRNYILYDFQRIKDDSWYSENTDKNISHWKTLLSNKKYHEHVFKFLSEFKDEEACRKAVENEENYAKRMLIGTSLLELEKRPDGMFLSNNGYIFMHYPTSPRPKYVMYEERNLTISKLVESKTITFTNDKYWNTNLQMYNGKEVDFKLDDKEYRWDETGSIYPLENVEKKVKVEDKVYESEEFIKLVSSI